MHRRIPGFDKHTHMEQSNLFFLPAYGIRFDDAQLQSAREKSSLDDEVAGGINASPLRLGLTIRCHFYLQGRRGNNY